MRSRSGRAQGAVGTGETVFELAHVVSEAPVLLGHNLQAALQRCEGCSLILRDGRRRSSASREANGAERIVECVKPLAGDSRSPCDGG